MSHQTLLHAYFTCSFQTKKHADQRWFNANSLTMQNQCNIIFNLASRVILQILWRNLLNTTTHFENNWALKGITRANTRQR